MASRPLPQSPSDLCLIRLSAIGDTCHTVPVVRALASAWPAARIVWVIGKIEHSLMRGIEDVHFEVFDKSRGLAGLKDLRRRLSARRFPLLLHMHASMRANLASLCARADVRLGFDRARARDYQWYFCNAHLAPRAQQHVMDGLFEFAEALGIARGEPRWDIPLSDDDRAFAADAVPAGEPTLILSPCTGQRFRNYRNWSVERYARVVDYAAERYGARTVLTGGRTAIEEQYGRGITERCRAAPRNLIGRTTLKQLLAVIARATAVLCPDSGPAHMATSVRTPVVGLYATSNRFRTGPYFSQHLVVDKYPEAVRREFGKPVEALRWGERVRNPDAMDLITVDDVVAKLDQAFAERGVTPLAPSH